MHMRWEGRPPWAQTGRGSVRIPWGPKGRELCGTVKLAGDLPDPLPMSCPQEVRDTGEKIDLDRVPKQPQEPVVAAGAQNLGSPRHGFMKPGPCQTGRPRGP